MRRKRFVWRSASFICILAHTRPELRGGDEPAAQIDFFQRFGMTQTSISSETLTAFRSELAEKYRLERELGQGGMAVVYLA